MKSKEDPKDKVARLREGRMSEIELRQTAEKAAGGLTSDLFSVYGLRGMKVVNSPSAAHAATDVAHITAARTDRRLADCAAPSTLR